MRVKQAPGVLFWSHVAKVEGACWEWQGAKCRAYGKFTSRTLGGTFAAHRLAWVFTFGEVPNGLHVLHRCDNPPCCNPAHLFLGTQADNVSDMHAKGRGAKGDRSGLRRHPESVLRGTHNPQAKLTEEAVAAIKSAPRSRGSQHTLAVRYGVSDATISGILAGKTWQGP